jgi:uncharacterized membrane protein
VSVDVTVQRTIASPREDVARFAMDPANDTRWITALKSVRKLSEGPVGPGTQVERVASFLGKRMEYVNEVVTYEPGVRLVMRSVKAPFPMTIAYEFEDAPGGAIARVRATGDAAGFYRIAGPLLSAAVRRGIEGDLERLKELLEAPTETQQA